MEQEVQVANTFDKITIEKIWKGALIAGGSALLTYILQAIAGMDFGDFTPVVVAVCGILINTVKSYFQGVEQ
jgi:hypothetical protein